MKNTPEVHLLVMLALALVIFIANPRAQNGISSLASEMSILLTYFPKVLDNAATPDEGVAQAMPNHPNLKDMILKMKTLDLPDFSISQAAPVSWQLYTRSAGAADSFGLGTGAFLERLLDRLQSGDLTEILGRLFTLAYLLPLLFALALLFAWYWRAGTVAARLLVPPLASLVYVAGLSIIYLGTNADLTWHLNTSARRVMESAQFLALTGALFMLESGNSNVAESAQAG